MINLIIGVVAVAAGFFMWLGVEVARESAQIEYQCGTDIECEAECREFLRPDEDPSVCDIDLRRWS